MGGGLFGFVLPIQQQPSMSIWSISTPLNCCYCWFSAQTAHCTRYGEHNTSGTDPCGPYGFRSEVRDRSFRSFCIYFIRTTTLKSSRRSLTSTAHPTPGPRRGFENGHRVGAPVVVLRSSGVLARCCARARRVTPNGARDALTPYKYSPEGVRLRLVPQRPRRSASEWSNPVRTSACGSKDDAGWPGKRGSHRPPAVPLRC